MRDSIRDPIRDPFAGSIERTPRGKGTGVAKARGCKVGSGKGPACGWISRRRFRNEPRCETRYETRYETLSPDRSSEVPGGKAPGLRKRGAAKSARGRDLRAGGFLVAAFAMRLDTRPDTRPFRRFDRAKAPSEGKGAGKAGLRKRGRRKHFRLPRSSRREERARSHRPIRKNSLFFTQSSREDHQTLGHEQRAKNRRHRRPR